MKEITEKVMRKSFKACEKGYEEFIATQDHSIKKLEDKLNNDKVAILATISIQVSSEGCDEIISGLFAFLLFEVVQSRRKTQTSLSE